MPITHARVVAKGDTGEHDDWNADHVVSGPSIGVRTATLIIAAADSKDKERADYLCDGTADEVQINQAITDLGAIRGRIVLLEGNYEIAATINLTSWVWLQGQGRNTIIKLADGADARMIDIPGTEAHIIVSDLALDGNKAHQAAPVLYGIRVIGQYSRIRNVWISSVRYCGIHVQGNLSIIDSCHIQTCGEAVNGDGILVISGDSCIFTNNVCENNARHGINFLSGCDYNIITGCVCGGNGISGIQMDGTSTYNTITGNQLIANGSYGYREDAAADDHNEIVANVAMLNGVAQVSTQGVNSDAAHNMVA